MLLHAMLSQVSTLSLKYAVVANSGCLCTGAGAAAGDGAAAALGGAGEAGRSYQGAYGQRGVAWLATAIPGAPAAGG
jgi:hypothetical protein